MIGGHKQYAIGALYIAVAGKDCRERLDRGYFWVAALISTVTNCTAAAPQESTTVTRTATVPGVVVAVVVTVTAPLR